MVHVTLRSIKRNVDPDMLTDNELAFTKNGSDDDIESTFDRPDIEGICMLVFVL